MTSNSDFLSEKVSSICYANDVSSLIAKWGYNLGVIHTNNNYYSYYIDHNSSGVIYNSNKNEACTFKLIDNKVVCTPMREINIYSLKFDYNIDQTSNVRNVVRHISRLYRNAECMDKDKNLYLQLMSRSVRALMDPLTSESHKRDLVADILSYTHDSLCSSCIHEDLCHCGSRDEDNKDSDICLKVFINSFIIPEELASRVWEIRSR